MFRGKSHLHRQCWFGHQMMAQTTTGFLLRLLFHTGWCCCFGSWRIQAQTVPRSSQGTTGAPHGGSGQGLSQCPSQALGHTPIRHYPGAGPMGGLGLEGPAAGQSAGTWRLVLLWPCWRRSWWPQGLKWGPGPWASLEKGSGGQGRTCKVLGVPSRPWQTWNWPWG